MTAARPAGNLAAMKRVPWLVVFLAALAVAALLFLREPEPGPLDLERLSRRLPEVTVPPLPPVPLPPAVLPTAALPTLPKSLPGTGMPVAILPKAEALTPIEDGKTIDYSTGLPMVRDTANEKAIMDKARQAMEEAMSGVTFGSPPPVPPKK